MAKRVLLKQVKNGDYFALVMTAKDLTEENEVNINKVWVKEGYDREEKKYYCYKFADINHYKYMKGTVLVWTDLYF